MKRILILLLFFAALQIKAQTKSDPENDTIQAAFFYHECDTCISMKENGFILGSARTTDKAKFPPTTNWIAKDYLDRNYKTLSEDVRRRIWKIDKR
jgi:hypothetical protein